MDMKSIVFAVFFLIGCSETQTFTGSRNSANEGPQQPKNVGQPTPPSEPDGPPAPPQSGDLNPETKNSQDELNPSVKGEVAVEQVVDEVVALNLQCDQESKQTSLNTVTNEVQLSLNSTCLKLTTQFDTKVNRMMDLVIVLDVTRSMQGAIDVVTENLQSFANLMVARGWNPRFSLVTFRDAIADTTGFKTAVEISEDLALQSASGGLEPQEAGQIAFAKALEILKQDKRIEAIPAILMVSDAPSWGKVKADLSIEVFETETKKAQEDPKLKNLQFYSSMGTFEYIIRDPIDLESEEIDFGEVTLDSIISGEFDFGEIVIERSPKKTLSGRHQINKLRKSTNLIGKDLPFPFTAKTLLDTLIISIEEVSKNVQVECKIDSLIFNEELIEMTKSEDLTQILATLTLEKIESEGQAIQIIRTCGEQSFTENHQLLFASDK